MIRTATISPCGNYRYDLTRRWNDEGRTICWLMLNPSTADGDVDDPTIRKVVGFSKRWLFDEAIVVNLFALRATDPKELLATPADLRVGPGNDEAILAAAARAEKVVCAWGAWGARPWARERSQAVYAILSQSPLCQLNKNLASGEPGHPLMPAYKTWCVNHTPRQPAAVSP